MNRGSRPERGLTPSHDSLEQAARWFTLLGSEEATGRDRLRWQAWLSEREDHRAAWNYVESIGRRFDTFRVADHGAEVAPNRARGRNTTRRELLGNVALLACGVSLLGSSWRHTPFPALLADWAADYRTGTGEIRDVLLSDGSRVWLNTNSAFDVDFQPRLRRLQLVSGEILVATGIDPRPLVVDTGQGRLHAPGARFAVRDEGDLIRLSVYDGTVAIQRLEGHAEPLDKGRAARFRRGGIASRVAADPAGEAWAGGLLLAEDITLGELVAELRRYTHGHIGVADDIAGLRVAGSFPLENPQRVLTMLEMTLPVRVRRPMPWWATIVSSH